MKRQRVSIVVGALGALLISPATPAAAGTGADGPACGLLSGFNCGALTITVDVDDSSCFWLWTEDRYACHATASASATATGWLNPGSLSLSLSGTCSASASSTSWFVGGATSPWSASCRQDVYAPRWGCTPYFSVSAQVTWTGVGAPRVLNASSSDRWCAPEDPPTGGKVVLFEHTFKGGGLAHYGGDDGNFVGMCSTTASV